MTVAADPITMTVEPSDDNGGGGGGGGGGDDDGFIVLGGTLDASPDPPWQPGSVVQLSFDLENFVGDQTSTSRDVFVNGTLADTVSVSGMARGSIRTVTADVPIPDVTSATLSIENSTETLNGSVSSGGNGGNGGGGNGGNGGSGGNGGNGGNGGGGGGGNGGNGGNGGDGVETIFGIPRNQALLGAGAVALTGAGAYVLTQEGEQSSQRGRPRSQQRRRQQRQSRRSGSSRSGSSRSGSQRNRQRRQS
jgi:hypothetical protein